MQFEYYLVYSIPKSNGDSVRLMCGYIERKISENQWLGAYVTTGNKPSVLSNERFKNQWLTEPRLCSATMKMLLGVLLRHNLTDRF